MWILWVMLTSHTQMKSKGTQLGFTLLEVMVALLVVAVTLGGTLKVMENSARNSTRLVNKTFANWVAMNQMTKLRISKEWPKFGEVKGDDEMSDRTWKWVQKTIKTEDENLKRIEISVWSDGKQDVDPDVTMVGFLPKP